jgi:hypothetical protein
MPDTPATEEALPEIESTWYEEALLIHFHSERKVNPDDSTDIEWISKPAKVLHRRILGDTETLNWIVANVDQIECISACDLLTEGY